MSEITITTQMLPGGGVWRLSWAFDPAMPTYYVWVQGRLSQTTKATTAIVAATGTVEVHVYDDPEDVAPACYPNTAILSWERVSGAAWYAVEQYIDSAWTLKENVRESGEWIYRWETPVLDDCTTAQFRISALTQRRDGAPKPMTFYWIRRPDRPDVTPSVAAGVLTFV